MKFRRFRAIARKEFIHIFRDPLSLGMAVAIPMLLLVLFGYALTLDVDNVGMIVWDQDETPTSRNFISRFGGSRYFNIRGYAQNYRDVVRALDTRNAMSALVIPRGFEGQIGAEQPASVQLFFDGTDANTATLALGYAEAVASEFSIEVLTRQLKMVDGRQMVLPLDVRPRVWFNAELESKNFIVPGLIAIIMMIISALLTSLTIAREWERGTMEQLISTPVKSSELILGKLLPYFAVGMFDVLLAVLMGEFLFNVPLRGSVVLLFIMAGIFIPGVLALGMLVSILTKSQLMASQMAMVLTFVPAMLLSGFVFPISNMPKVIQFVTYLIPARYYVAIQKGIYLKGIGLRYLAGDAILLVAFGMVIIFLAIIKFKKTLN